MSVRLRLKSKNMMPHGGKYEINRPDLGMVGSGTTWDMLCNRVRDYRKANGIPIGLGFAEELESHICQLYPAEAEPFDASIPRARNLSLHDVVVGTQVMLSVLGSSSPLVDRAEAERRAKICVDCPWNVTFSKPCSGICAELVNVVKFITGAQGTQYDINLRSCSICGCYLTAAIWVDKEIQTRPLSDDQRAQFKTVKNCWKA